MRALLVMAFIVLAGCGKKELQLPKVHPVPEDDLTTFQLPQRYVPPPAPVEVRPPPIKPPVANEIRYKWVDGQADTVPVGIAYPTVVRFEAGENIGSVIDGDREYMSETEEQTQKAPAEKQPNCHYGARWQYCKAVQETAYTPIESLIFTAAHAQGPAHKTGVVVTTNKRSYYLELQAVKVTKTRLVSWSYPPPPPVPQKPKEPGLFPDLAEQRVYHVGYTYTIPDAVPDWTPLKVWSDLPTQPAAKIYLQFAPAMLHQRMPLIRGMDEAGKPFLLNSRQYGTWVVIDELAPRLELRRGADKDAQIVIVSRETLTPISCPGAVECPIFP